jgi:hypothetical protein
MVSNEIFASVLARIAPPSGRSAQQVYEASIKAAKDRSKWEGEANLSWPESEFEQRKFYVLKRGLAARNAVLTAGVIT